jgi:uncharacterized iron-regulated protein
MKKFHYFLLFIIVATSVALKSDNPAYVLYDADGKEVKYKNLVNDALDADVVLFGELHNNPIIHWLELELAKDVFAEKGKDLVIAAEMFETDNQLIIDEYLAGTIKQSNFEKEVKLWKNYPTDYKPLVEFAKENSLRFVASNIPRRYASLVNSKGFESLDSLSADAKVLIAPLPVAYDPELPGYKSMMDTTGSMGQSHVTPNLPKAQAIKDATMANSILKNWQNGKLLIHYHGSFHSDNYDGIYWYLKKQNPDLKILTISAVEQDTIQNLSDGNLNLANYIICVPSNMTKTY